LADDGKVIKWGQNKLQNYDILEAVLQRQGKDGKENEDTGFVMESMNIGNKSPDCQMTAVLLLGRSDWKIKSTAVCEWRWRKILNQSEFLSLCTDEAL